MSRQGEGQEGQGTTGQLRDKAQQVGEGLREMGGQVRDAAREQYDRLRDSANEYYEQGRQTAREWQENVETYVQEQPVKSLLIAAGVGVLIGLLMKRR
jgi:ElaB/YqjD/DUF883 family membrane-anchored ribosome-binding protein